MQMRAKIWIKTPLFSPGMKYFLKTFHPRLDPKRVELNCEQGGAGPFRGRLRFEVLFVPVSCLVLWMVRGRKKSSGRFLFSQYRTLQR
jgi:hypothetical protein